MQKQLQYIFILVSFVLVACGGGGGGTAGSGGGSDQTGSGINSESGGANSNAVSGYLWDATGNPISKATLDIVVQSLTGDFIVSQETNQNGQ